MRTIVLSLLIVAGCTAPPDYTADVAAELALISLETSEAVSPFIEPKGGDPPLETLEVVTPPPSPARPVTATHSPATTRAEAGRPVVRRLFGRRRGRR